MRAGTEDSQLSELGDDPRERRGDVDEERGSRRDGRDEGSVRGSENDGGMRKAKEAIGDRMLTRIQRHFAHA